MSIQLLQDIIDQIKHLDGRSLHGSLGDYQNQLTELLGQETFNNTKAKKGAKATLISALQQSLDREITNDIIHPQREQQKQAITRGSIEKVDRLPLNAKLHLLKINSLLNNLQLAFSDPTDYIEFDSKHFVGMNKEQIQDEQWWAIREYLVIHPQKAKNIYQKLGLPLSPEGTKKLKEIFSEAKVHTYTSSRTSTQFKEKYTPRITYIHGFPMLFGKNLVHISYGHNTTRAEKAKFDIDTGAKIFDDFYSLIRAHSHIQDSEEHGIQALTELNTDFTEALSIINTSQQHKELENIIANIIQTLKPKQNSKVKKAEEQDLIYILKNSHPTRNNKKLLAAWKKIKERITSQQSIKNTVALQQNALQRDCAQQEIAAKELIAKLHKHIENFNAKGRSARKLAKSYQSKLYAKPFFDLHDHIIQLEDQAKLQKWMPFTLKQKIEIDLLLQRRYINTLKIIHDHKTGQKTINQQKIKKLIISLNAPTDIGNTYKQLLTQAQYITQEREKIQDQKSLDQREDTIKIYRNQSWEMLIANSQ